MNYPTNSFIDYRHIERRTREDIKLTEKEMLINKFKNLLAKGVMYITAFLFMVTVLMLLFI